MDDKNRYNQEQQEKNKKRRMMILIPLHIMAVVCIAFLIVSLIQAQQEIKQIAMIPTPASVEPLPQESVPLVNGAPSATATPSSTAAPAAVSPTASPVPTSTPTIAPTATARPTTRPTKRPTTAPTPESTQAPTPEPTPEYTYSVSAKQGVAPAGYVIVSVVVEPAGSYTVTYDGQAMEYNGSKYYLTVQALAEGESYRSHVRVSKN